MCLRTGKFGVRNSNLVKYVIFILLRIRNPNLIKYVIFILLRIRNPNLVKYVIFILLRIRNPNLVKYVIFILLRIHAKNFDHGTRVGSPRRRTMWDQNEKEFTLFYSLYLQVSTLYYYSCGNFVDHSKYMMVHLGGLVKAKGKLLVRVYMWSLEHSSRRRTTFFDCLEVEFPLFRFSRPCCFYLGRIKRRKLGASNQNIV